MVFSCEMFYKIWNKERTKERTYVLTGFSDLLGIILRLLHDAE